VGNTGLALLHLLQNMVSLSVEGLVDKLNIQSSVMLLSHLEQVTCGFLDFFVVHQQGTFRCIHTVMRMLMTAMLTMQATASCSSLRLIFSRLVSTPSMTILSFSRVLI
jgi:hypothetical protein